MKFLALLCLMFNLLLGASAFKETRYLYALDKTLALEGFITFGEHTIVIEYTKPNTKVLTYFEDKLSIQDENGYQMVEAQQMPSLTYLFMIIKAVHEENTLLLEEFFDANVEQNSTYLSPKEAISHVLFGVRIERKNKRLSALHVTMKNGDRIDIEIME
ncbi:hypothetical protein [Sulfurospirillum barnesii]|uniref:Uncharacterized protein n=1 Tax=Sulfurospirillum barnesii (strain ATCC 700032 / DSM 10660 / SES-3) TaxID=760154 RepID=I3XZZ5_SULBS|nr:hypothetical protein [Sulfurospirillum barnesii]AFL69519.1 hypothetical protein Sulba_2244 [Sulfurospirillum barnesii SES-3]